MDINRLKLKQPLVAQVVRLFAIFICMFSGNIIASDSEQQFSALRAKIAEIRGQASLQYLSKIDALTQNLSDCNGFSVSELHKSKGPNVQVIQYIYNGFYTWSRITTDYGDCVILDSPFKRLLSKSEAIDLLAASNSEFPVPKAEPNDKPLIIYPVPFDPSQIQQKNGQNETGPSPSYNRPDHRVPVSSPQYPYDGLTLAQAINPSGGTISGSAVQLSPYVYLTAAHVVADKITGVKFTQGHVIPQYKLVSSPSQYDFADVAWDTSYQIYPDQNVHRFAHDIGFIYVATAHPLSSYVPYYIIKSSRDVPNPPDGDGCRQGDLSLDAFAFSNSTDTSQSDTWYNGSVCDGHPATRSHTAGYPGDANGNPTPVDDPEAQVYGQLIPNGTLLYHPAGCSDCLPFNAMATWITAGESGGPVYGENFANSGSSSTWALLGINGSAIATDPAVGAYDAGVFDYNLAFIQSKLAWTPASLITVFSPTSGSSYPQGGVPAGSATAGFLTNQLSWSSSINGVIGTGQSVNLNTLSVGNHTLTLTVPGAPGATKAISLTIGPPVPPPPAVTLSPATVPVGAQVTSGPYVIYYSEPSGASLDWNVSINSGVPHIAFTSTGSGTYHGMISAGTTYTYTVLPHGMTAPTLVTTSVRGVVASPSSFVANPTTVSVPGTIASGTSVLTWNAPGYQGLDWCSKINAAAWQCGALTTPISGSSAVSVPVGSTYAYRFYPTGAPNQGGTVGLIASVTVAAVRAAPTTISANPAHITVPANGASGISVITWNAPGYPALDWCGKVDAGAWGCGSLVTAPSGSTTVTIPVNSTYSYRLYPHGTPNQGGTAGLIASLSISATH